MKPLLIFFAALLTLSTSHAQFTEKQKVIEDIKALAERYRNASYISFDLLYRYADEQRPNIWIDSLQGSLKLNGNRYWYSMDNTEVIGTSDCTVMLFKEDKIMYLSKAAPASQKVNPLILLDSFLLNNESVSVSAYNEKDQRKIILQFPPGSVYKRVEYYIDRKTGFVSRMINVVQADQLYDPAVKPLIEGRATYAVVEALFSHYQEGNPDEKQFDTSHYFSKLGNDYVPVEPYRDYKIFLGTPDPENKK